MMEARELARAVRQATGARYAYLKSKDRADLIAMRRAEAKLNKAVDEILGGEDATTDSK